MLKIVFLVIIYNTCCIQAPAQSSRMDCKKEINRGEAFLRRFMPAEALESYQAAIRMSKEMNDDPLYALALFGAGQAVWYRGSYTEAADTIKLALQLFKKMHDTPNAASALRILSNIYDDQGDYENAFKTIQEALELLKTFRDDQNIVLSLVQMGALYANTGDYETAQEYYRKALRERPYRGDYPYRELNHRLGELYVAMNKIDSARHFYNNALIGNPDSKVIRLKIGESYILKNNPDSALAYLIPLSQQAKVNTDISILIPTLLGIGRANLDKKNLPGALSFTQHALTLARERNARQNKREAFLLLSSIYEAQGEAAKALQYRKLYEQIRDSVISGQFKAQLFAFKQRAGEMEAIRTLKAEKKFAEQAIVAICLLTVLIVLIITLRHKNEKLHFKQRAADLEMQALRAQMNPHFIFNCLSAINHFILNNEADRASDYLTRFSRLIRMVLVNAGKATVSLEEELAMLKLYLNMEQLRFKDAFDYYIYHDPEVRPATTFVPSFILQPFCENAIWHGLLHKEGKGQLNIHFKMEQDVLICTITDNGIGMEKAAGIKTNRAEKQASFGHKLSAERLALFNGDNGKGTSFIIQDIKDERGAATGTQVILKIRNKQDYD